MSVVLEITSETTAQEAICAAADLLDESTWIQGSYGGDGLYCMMGAVRQVIFGTAQHIGGDAPGGAWSLMGRAELELDSRARMQSGSWATAIGWNDEPGRKKDEVLSLMRVDCEPQAEEAVETPMG